MPQTRPPTARAGRTIGVATATTVPTALTAVPAADAAVAAAVPATALAALMTSGRVAAWANAECTDIGNSPFFLKSVTKFDQAHLGLHYIWKYFFLFYKIFFIFLKKRRSFWQLRTSFTTEYTETSQRNTDINAKRSKNRSCKHFLIFENPFASFGVFRKIRVRARLLCLFSFFSVCFCVSSALSVVKSDQIGTRLPEELKKKETHKTFHQTDVKTASAPIKNLRAISTRRGRSSYDLVLNFCFFLFAPLREKKNYFLL